MYADIIVIVLYMLLVNYVGLRSSRAKSMGDYFLGARSIAWPIACFSIVATETSTLTFISIPGLAYIRGMGFLQVAAGYIIGRIIIAVLLLPKYFEGNYDTVYHFLQNRFGVSSRRAIAVIFHVTRLLADSVRLFATAIPLSLLTGMDYRLSVLIIGLATFAYTWYGGIRSVVIVDTIQMWLYLVSAAAGMYVITSLTGHSFIEIFRSIPAGSLRIFSTGTGPGDGGILGSYNVFSGLIGGAFLSFASHGTDHLMVQRVLSCKGLAQARKAMIMSGVVVFFQFALFMLLGLFIKSFLGGKAFAMPDEIMPFFIIEYLPPGIKGLMLAGIFAAAMSTLSSSINSLSASTTMDIIGLSEKSMAEERKMRISRGISLFWTLVIIGISTLLTNNKSPLVELGLGIASLTYGGMVAIFIQARFFKDFSDKAALAGVFAGIIGVVVLAGAFHIFWPWFVPIGFVISFTCGCVVNIVLRGREG